MKHQAMEQLSYAPVVKVALQTKSRYWQQQGLSGFAEMDHSAEIWSPSWDRPGRPESCYFTRRASRLCNLIK
jgi:monoamine oxidase